MRALVFRQHLLEALSLRNMAASTSAANAAASNPQGPASVGPSVDSPTLQYSMILEHLIGDKRPVKDLNPASEKRRAEDDREGNGELRLQVFAGLCGR